MIGEAERGWALAFETPGRPKAVTARLAHRVGSAQCNPGPLGRNER
jgi:hypothetical protein